MRRPLPASVFAVVMLVMPFSAGRADEIGTGAGFDRCASYSGNVSGGTASMSICIEPGAGVSAEIPGVPTPYAGADWYGCIRVTRTSTHQVCGKPAAPVPLVMDPAIQAGVVDFALTGGGGTLTAKLTLTANPAPPVPNYGLFIFCDMGDGAFSICFGGAGGGVTRAATATGTISSTLRGGGAVSGGSGQLSQSAGGGFSYFSFDFEGPPGRATRAAR